MLMENIPAEVHAAVAAVCPIFGVSIGAFDDRSTWTVQFRPEASDEEKAAAQTVIDGYTVVMDTPETRLT